MIRRFGAVMLCSSPPPSGRARCGWRIGTAEGLRGRAWAGTRWSRSGDPSVRGVRGIGSVSRACLGRKRFVCRCTAILACGGWRSQRSLNVRYVIGSTALKARKPSRNLRELITAAEALAPGCSFVSSALRDRNGDARHGVGSVPDDRGGQEPRCRHVRSDQRDARHHHRRNKGYHRGKPLPAEPSEYGANRAGYPEDHDAGKRHARPPLRQSPNG